MVSADPRPVRRVRAAVLRAAAWLLPVAAGALSLFLLREARAAADAARAREAMGAGRFEEASARLLPWADSRRWAPRARTGRSILSALGPSGTEAHLSAADVAEWPVREVLETALRRGDFPGARRLAAAALPALPAAVLYEAAAALEMGDRDAARARADAHADTFAAWDLGRRVRLVLSFQDQGATRVVHDRAGEVLGFVTADGAFHPRDTTSPEWLPAAATASLPAGGPGIRLSLDAGLSRESLAALGGRRGTIVLLDVATGAVRVAASDARTRAAHASPLTDERREPASIAKLVTTAAALRAGLDPDTEIAAMTCRGVAHYQGGPLWCSFPAGRLAGLAHAMGVSCNVAFANLAVRLGWAPMIEEFRRWGFDASGTPWAGHVLQTAGTERRLASLGIGLDATDITPLHGALLGAVLARGTMPAPRYVDAEDGWLGLSPRPLPSPTANERRVLPDEWLPTFRRAVEAVTGPGGTAADATPPAFPVAMKTGTASAIGVGYHVNYVGAGPLPDPRLAFCVRVTHQPTSPAVNREARVVLRQVLETVSRRPLL
jgi:peptidoglycan glycosyltransferase